MRRMYADISLTYLLQIDAPEGMTEKEFQDYVDNEINEIIAFIEDRVGLMPNDIETEILKEN